jgi:deoxyribodipyrimidine photo-lyase
MATDSPRLMWFRRDLRLSDLPALAAGADGADVLACFVLDPRLTASASPRRMQFLGDSLRELRTALDGRLLITRGRPERRIPELARAIGAGEVHVSADFSPLGVRRDDAVRAGLGEVELVATGSPYLVTPGRITKPDGTAYQVFTPFHRRWLEHGWRAPARTGPATARWIDPSGVGVALHDIPDPGAELNVKAGEQAARRRWKRFVEHHLDRYADDRDRPDLDATSRMSAYLHFGNIHPRTMAADLSGNGAGPRAYRRELAFRDFYAGVLAHWPRSAWWNFTAAFDAISVDEDADAQRRFAAWKQGRTGFPLVDAGMRELCLSGFMHNRVRMVAASFLVKDLHLPWQWGARWFLEQLVDADVASNNHGWQWAAGSGTDAAPYFRVFNPDRQAREYDPDGSYVRRWIPELGTPDYPEPIVDHARERAEALRRYGEIH